MTKEVSRRLLPVSRAAAFAVVAIAFSLIMGVANAGQTAPSGGDAYNYTRGGGG
jgi:hypothetical protein